MTYFSGAKLFDLKATHGLPFDFSLARLIGELGLSIDWPEFIETARKNGWWDFQSYEAICYAMADALIPRDEQEHIKNNLRSYIMSTLPTETDDKWQLPQKAK